jgi:hypothetical protein
MGGTLAPAPPPGGNRDLGRHLGRHLGALARMAARLDLVEEQW